MKYKKLDVSELQTKRYVIKGIGAIDLAERIKSGDSDELTGISTQTRMDT